MTSKKKITNLGQDRKTNWTAEEINNTEMPDVQWLVKEILPQGFFFLAGRLKMGKSFMTLQLCISIVTGKPFLGYEVKQGNVLYISLEDNVRRIKKRMANMGMVGVKGLANLEIVENWTPLNTRIIPEIKKAPTGLDLLIKKLESKNYALCVMDTYAKSFLLKDNNDAVEAGRCLKPLYEMTRAGEFTFGFIDHNRKNNQFSGDPIDDIAGTGAKGGVADTVWSLARERGKQDAKMSIASRDTEIDFIDLQFDKDRTLWTNKTEEIVKPGTIQAKVLAHLGNNGNEIYVRKLSKTLGYDPALISRELNELVNKGILIKGEKESMGRVPYILKRKIN